MDVENKVGLDGWWNVKIKRMIFILFLILLNWGVKKMWYCMCIRKSYVVIFIWFCVFC